MATQIQLFLSKWAIMSIVAIVGPILANNFILQYISFLGQFSNYIATFIVLLVLLPLTNYLTKQGMGL